MLDAGEGQHGPPRDQRRLFMRQLAVAVLSLIAAVLFAAPGSAGPTPRFADPPPNFTCSLLTADTIECHWDVLVDANGQATKYSVDAVANFDLAGGGTQSADFDFGTPVTSVTIPLSSFPTDINGDTVPDTLVSVVLRVKGLAPPGKREFNQHNAFSGTVTCAIGGTCAP